MMKDIYLRLIALQTVIGELGDIAREDKQKAGNELLILEPRINIVICETFELLSQLPINEAPSISIFPT